MVALFLALLIWFCKGSVWDWFTSLFKLHHNNNNKIWDYKICHRIYHNMSSVWLRLIGQAVGIFKGLCLWFQKFGRGLTNPVLCIVVGITFILTTIITFTIFNYNEIPYQGSR